MKSTGRDNSTRMKEWIEHLRDPEIGCREYYLKADIDLASICIISSVLVILPTGYLDYLYYGLTPDFFASVLAESLLALFSLVMIFFIRRAWQVERYDRLVFTWSFGTSLAALAFTNAQPNRVVENLLFSILFIFANFILLQNRFVFRFIPALVICLTVLVAVASPNPAFSIANRYMFSLATIMLMMVGLIFVTRNNYFRLTTYTLQMGVQEAMQLYETMALTDPLTGISNRRSFFQQAELEWKIYKRYTSVFCIAMIDLDRFKLINDRHGHAQGDEALKLYAALLEKQMRSTDTCARIGGEEFAFIFRATSREDALRAINRLRDEVADLKHTPGMEYLCTFSAGVAEVHAMDGNIDATLRRADRALYQAKELGRDRIELA